METTRTRRPRQARKPEPRSIKLEVPLNEFGCNGVVRITRGELVQLYFIDRIPSDWGIGFGLEKVISQPGEDTATYYVNLGEDGNSCDCAGFTRWGHCKHADGLAVLKSRSAI